MKIILTILTFFILCNPPKSYAQLEQGNWMVGAQLTNLRFGFGDYNNIDLNITPKIGYFIQNNVVLGAYGKLEYHKVTDIKSTYNYGVGVYGRYFFNSSELNPFNDGRFFIEAQVGAGGNTTSGPGLEAGFGIGYAYFITKNVSIEALAMLQSTFGTSSSTGLNLGVGFQIYLPSEKLKTEHKLIQQDLNK